MGNNVTGARQVVEQNLADAISIRLMVAGEPATITSGTIAIYAPGGTSELVAATSSGLTVSGAVATYSRTWSDTLFSRRAGYRARWSLVASSVTYTKDQRFDVVRRRFESQLADADITAEYPYLASRLPSGITSFMTWRNRAWRHIEETIRARWHKKLLPIPDRYSEPSPSTIYPGNVFYPETFRDAHLELAVAYFCRSDAFDLTAQGEDWERYKDSMARGESLLDAALSNIDIDIDDDLSYDDENVGLHVGIEMVR